MILLLILAFLLIILIEVPGLMREKKSKTLIVFWFYLIIGFVLSATQVLDIKIPNPHTYIVAVFKPFAEWMKAP